MVKEFEDFTRSVMCLDFSNPTAIQDAKVYRVGVTNAADRGLDMYANWGPAVQIKHLSLDTDLAESIVSEVNSDKIVIVCKTAEKNIIVSLLTQIGWRNKIQSSRLNKKGSLQNQTAAKTDRELNNLLTDKEFAIVNESVEKCGLYYIENFQKQFDSHVKNIDSYKLEIQEESKKKYDKYLMGFIIEDSSPLGSVYFDGGLKCVDLVYSKEFLDVFEQTPQLDFVVFAMTGNEDNRILSFISKNTISLHRERQITVSSISKFLFENSICAGGKIYIPNK